MAEEMMLPLPNEFTQPYWDGAKRHTLLAQKCTTCDSIVWYPREFCPECSSHHLEWTELSGEGHVYSYTVMRQTPIAALNHMVPFILAIVQTVEGLRMYSNVVCPVDDCYIGMPVRVHFHDVTEDVTLVKWTPA